MLIIIRHHAVIVAQILVLFARGGTDRIAGVEREHPPSVGRGAAGGGELVAPGGIDHIPFAGDFDFVPGVRSPLLSVGGHGDAGDFDGVDPLDPRHTQERFGQSVADGDALRGVESLLVRQSEDPLHIEAFV